MRGSESVRIGMCFCSHSMYVTTVTESLPAAALLQTLLLREAFKRPSCVAACRSEPTVSPPCLSSLARSTTSRLGPRCCMHATKQRGCMHACVVFQRSGYQMCCCSGDAIVL